MKKFLLSLLLVNMLLIPTNLMADELKEIVLHSDSKFSIEASELKGYIKIDMSYDFNEIYHINVKDINYIQQYHSKGAGEKKFIIKTDDLKITIYIYKKGIDGNKIIELINKVNK